MAERRHRPTSAHADGALDLVRGRTARRDRGGPRGDDPPAYSHSLRRRILNHKHFPAWLVLLAVISRR